MAQKKGTLPALFVKHPGHAPETGGIGVADPNGVYVHAGYDSDLTETATAEHEDTPLFSYYDLVASALSGLTYNWGMTFKLIDDVLAKWCCNLPIAGNALTMAVSKTLLYSQKIDGIENYKLFKGCLPTSCTIRVTRPMVQATVAGRAATITDFSATSGLTSPNLTALGTKPTIQPWTGKDTTTGVVGVHPLTIAGIQMACMEFTMTVNWVLAELTPLGLITYQEIGPASRRCTLEFVTYRKGDNFLSDLSTYTPVAVDFKLHNASPVLWAHFTDCYKVSYTPVGLTPGGGDFTTERVGMIAMSVNLSNT
jgi:hypothetical protein